MVNKELKVAVIGSYQINKGIILLERSLHSFSWARDNQEHCGISLAASIEDSDIVVFQGGSDINPAYYNQRPGKKTGSIMDIRDENEIQAFNLAVKLNKFIVGICRGAQLACIMSGGELIQDVGGHGNSHKFISLDDGGVYDCNSMHHQMMMPYYLKQADYDILGYTNKSLRVDKSNYYTGEDDLPYKLNFGEKLLSVDTINFFMEPEVVYFYRTNSFAIQFHPESGMTGRFPDTMRWLNYHLFNFYYAHKNQQILQAP